MSAEILPGDDKRPIWIVLSKEKGTLKIRAWMKTFGLVESAEAALAAVSQRARVDAQFRRQAKGQQFFPARIDWLVEVGQDLGILTRYRNEVGTWG